MTALVRLINSSVGKKFLMALTGAGLVGFTLIHMLGNLQLFIGQEAINKYAVLLHASAEVIWGFRLAMLGMVAVHIWAAVSLTIENRAARPAGYDTGKPLKASWASRYMAVTGLVVLAFIVFHLMHFTSHNIDPSYTAMRDSEGRHDVYNMVVKGFSNLWISGFYILSVGLLCQHLSHGVQSLFQSLGLVTPSRRPLIKLAGLGFAALIFVGMSAVPLSVLLGCVKPIH